MAKKRKTLPKDFRQLLEKADIDELKQVFEKCAVEAYGDPGKKTAIAFDKCPHELALWLIDQGADLHATDTWGNTPLHSRSRSTHGNISSLLELGANVDNDGSSIGTPLHAAADSHNVQNTKLLLQHGAKNTIPNSQGLLPIELALRTCRNIDIENTLEICKLHLQSGVVPTGKMQSQVSEIGENFEFHRANFNKEMLTSVVDALDKLYTLFQVEKVPKRKMHDGKSSIIPKETHWQNQHQELWEYLVPSSGPCQTIQGELIRISGRVADELERNGGINWDTEFRKMTNAYIEYLKLGNCISIEELDESKQLMSVINKAESDINRMAEIAVKWVLLNPIPISLGPVSYNR